MASYPYPSLLLAFALLSLTITTCHGTPTSFVEAACATTRYPQLCLSSLLPYAARIHSDPVQLASIALNLSVVVAESSLAITTRMVVGGRGSMKPMEAAAMRDCMEEVSEAVDELRRSNEVMKHIGGRTLGEQIGNMQTWVSAALTNANSCADGLRGPSMGTMMSRMMELVHMSSNALCFINALVAH